MAKRRSAKQRERELEQFYADIGLGSEERRRYLSNLGAIAPAAQQPKLATFIETGTSSISQKESESAGLE